ncbi:MAG: PD40 domain-containing protein [Planctomycetes bacterium]|nr:PD40 domain-containing protein [Planctomycetota bacterium]
MAAAAPAQESIRFARTPDISPDGKQVAFSYLGDIWIVDAAGGIARPVSMHEAHDIGPVFSPDGKMLAFSSKRHGDYDVFVVPVLGGHPRRLTFDSADDMVNSWSPDGKQILFASTRSTAFPASFELYRIPTEGGRVRQVSISEGKEGVFSPKGDKIAYVRGPGTWYRKGYRGSSNDDIWICNADGTHNQQLTRFDGQDTSPMWSADGQFVYYVSECFGTPANLVRQDAAGKTPPQQITFHKDDSVRRARISGNGEWIVYECGADIWIVPTREDGKPRKLDIQVYADDKTNPEYSKTFTTGASEFIVSPDEKNVAFAVHGQLFLMPIAGGKATRLTQDTAYDHGIAWSPDARQIIFISDRNGYDDLYSLEADDASHPTLAKAHQFKVKQLTNTPEPELGVSFSPDGKRVAFLRAGKLCTMKPDGSDPKTVVDEFQVIDYDWSPDSKWLVYARVDGSFASELFILPADGSARGRNVTRYATYNGGVTWSRTGNKIAFLSQRHQHISMWVLSLQKPAAPDAPASKDIDWDDIHLRVEEPAPMAAEEGAISPDGTKVAFRSAGLTGDDLWVASTSGSSVRRLTHGNFRPEQIQWSPSGTRVYFKGEEGTLHVARPGGDDPDTISFRAKMTIRQDEEFQEMFEQSWRALYEQFYDSKFHGVDMLAVRAKYRPLVKHVALKEDLYALISLMMGELNASHMGITGPSSRPEETTADLGLLFDETYPGPGLKVAEVLKRGPADKRGIRILPGDVIRSIDGVELTEKVNLSKLLNDKTGETVVLQVTSNPAADPHDTKAWRRDLRVQIQAGSRDSISKLMYERWVEHNARRVAELSHGKLGYIHIPSMDEAGLDRFLRALYSDNFDKEAIVLDVRFNSGGFTHDQVLNYLGAREHTYFRQRYGGEGLVLRSFDRKWTRPLVLLINNRSYSDAEIFPSAFRTLSLGKLVGQPTGGFVIGTSSVKLIDGSTFRVPRTGVFTLKGVDMEEHGVAPDILVEPQPDQLARGADPQLDKAVEVLQQDVVVWKKAHPDLVHREEEAKTATTVGASAGK